MQIVTWAGAPRTLSRIEFPRPSGRMMVLSALLFVQECSFRYFRVNSS